MSDAGSEGVACWMDACLAAALFAVDPHGLGGVQVKAHAGPVRDSWMAHLRACLADGSPVRRVPVSITDDRLLGGLDLTATLQRGVPVAERGLLAESDGGVIVLPMAERLPASTAARIVAAVDCAEVQAERDGLALSSPARFGVIALDEGLDGDEAVPGALPERMAFHINLDAVSLADAQGDPVDRDVVTEARRRLPTVVAADTYVDALCEAGMALGISSIRAPMLALKAARAAAALDGRGEVTQEYAALAARLVLAPRATQVPSETPPDDDQSEPPPDPEPETDRETDEDTEPTEDRQLHDVVLQAAEAAIPLDLLARLANLQASRERSRAAGKMGAQQRSNARGRPVGTRPGKPDPGVRLNVLETLRAAAPWQRLRRGAGTDDKAPGASDRLIEIRREDFRVHRFKQPGQTTTIFAVDASGSSALNRLAEVKGAIELLLADCYVRRDQVALVAFRKAGAEVLLPPTRSLVRAKRSMASLPGGGATPLAAGIQAASALAAGERRRGHTPNIVVMTDGGANMARDGTTGRAAGEADALAAARMVRASGERSLVIDTSPRGDERARRLAQEMGALYLPLPQANAGAVSEAVQACGAAGMARTAGHAV